MYKKILLMIFAINSIVFANGNINYFELGSAVYCDLDGDELEFFGLAQHYHTGIYKYFEYLANGNGRILYSEMNWATFAGNASENKSIDNYIGISTQSIDQLRTNFINTFNGTKDYHGSYSRMILPETRSSIAATAQEVGSSNIGYTWADMLDSKNIHGFLGWEADWQGTVYDIDELRCDGLVEFSYEKNEVIVLKTGYSVTDNLAHPGNSRVEAHADFHNGDYNAYEMCPRIQAGENHRGSGTGRSFFDPLISNDPIISNFSYDEFGTTPSLNFKVSDNASVKSYVLIQVKRSTESVWHTLVDMYNNKWQFKAVDLTDWNGSIQYDYFHVYWSGSFEGGRYAENSTSSNFDIKITTIDQGANYNSESYTISSKILAPIYIISTTNNVGSIKVDTQISGSFLIRNRFNQVFNLEIINNSGIDLDPSTPNIIDNIIYETLNPGYTSTINYGGTTFSNYGPFTESIIIQDNSINIYATHNVLGTMLLPDFCYGETQVKSASPEEQLFDGAFIGYFGYDKDSLRLDKSKSIKERLSFAYELLKQPTTESVVKICKMIIDLYPESEMGISFYAMGLLWEASLSKEAPKFGEKEFKNYLKELTERKMKYKINGYAQLILSLLDVGKDVKGLEKLFSDYEYDGLKELASFHQFIHYYIYKKDKETARKVSDQLDKIFVDSRYGYQAHLIFGDDGYTLEGLKELLKKNQSSLLAKRGESKNDILSEMPTEYKLFNNYPNPFNPTTTIKYSVPKVSNVKLKIYNMMGQLIKTLVNETKAPGFYNTEWNGTNENNSSVASGIYFYRFESGNFIANNKMILIK